MDYSIKVSHLDRDQIIEELGICNEGRGTEKLRISLAKRLKDKHPIHKKLQSLSSAQLNQMLSNLSLIVKNRQDDRKRKAISDYFFREFPDAPLTNLIKVMEEDAYFAELTGM